VGAQCRGHQLTGRAAAPSVRGGVPAESGMARVAIQFIQQYTPILKAPTREPYVARGCLRVWVVS